MAPLVKKKQASRPKKLRKRSQIGPHVGIKITRPRMKMTCKRHGELDTTREHTMHRYKRGTNK